MIEEYTDFAQIHPGPSFQSLSVCHLINQRNLGEISK